MEYDQDWQEKYADMITTPERAVTHIHPGHRVFIGTGCGEPTVLVSAMTNRAGQFAGV